MSIRIQVCGPSAVGVLTCRYPIFFFFFSFVLTCRYPIFFFFSFILTCRYPIFFFFFSFVLTCRYPIFFFFFSFVLTCRYPIFFFFSFVLTCRYPNFFFSFVRWKLHSPQWGWQCITGPSGFHRACGLRECGLASFPLWVARRWGRTAVDVLLSDCQYCKGTALYGQCWVWNIGDSWGGCGLSWAWTLSLVPIWLTGSRGQPCCTVGACASACCVAWPWGWPSPQGSWWYPIWGLLYLGTQRKRKVFMMGRDAWYKYHHICFPASTFPTILECWSVSQAWIFDPQSRFLELVRGFLWLLWFAHKYCYCCCCIILTFTAIEWVALTAFVQKSMTAERAESKPYHPSQPARDCPEEKLYKLSVLLIKNWGRKAL